MFPARNQAAVGGILEQVLQGQWKLVSSLRKSRITDVMNYLLVLIYTIFYVIWRKEE